MLEAIAALDGIAPLLAGMARYHLGYAGTDLRAVDPRSVDRGKRIRPAIALLAAGAAGGNPIAAAPVAAAIELLHNFTLIHDDIQDQSPTRRHRPTVWSLWGIGQAINAGDALFAAAHLPLYRLPATGIDAALTLRVLEAFDRMTIAIVEGQTLDLGFETRADVSARRVSDDDLRQDIRYRPLRGLGGLSAGGRLGGYGAAVGRFRPSAGAGISGAGRRARYLGDNGGDRQGRGRRHPAAKTVAPYRDVAGTTRWHRPSATRPSLCGRRH